MTLPASTIFSPLKVGPITLSHRIAMAPMTRLRNSADHIPTDASVEYYTQRSAYPGTLIISEATIIHKAAEGLPHTPGIHTPAQIAGWKKVVDAVHANGSHIFLQLGALGRAANSQVLAGQGEGFGVVSSSDLAFEGGETPRPLTEEEVRDYVQWHAAAAKAFVEECGGDGVEIHGANGYLIDQFTQTNSNKRTDHYGGTVENRARFALEIVDAVASAVGSDRTALRLSPYSAFQGMKMDQRSRDETFGYVLSQLKASHPELAYLHLITPRADTPPADLSEDDQFDQLAALWAPNTLLVAGGKDPKNAEEDVSKYPNSVVVYGRHFLANPDLVAKIQWGGELTKGDRSTYYVPEGVKGYNDYPVQYGPAGRL